MTIGEIASYCEFLDCRVSLGDPQVGFIQIDGTGVLNHSYTFGRFNMLHELAGLPDSRDVIQKATLFKVSLGDSERSLSREEFSAELSTFQKKVGIA